MMARDTHRSSPRISGRAQSDGALPTAFLVAEAASRRTLLTAQLSSARIRTEVYHSLDNYFDHVNKDLPGCVVVDTPTIAGHDDLKRRFRSFPVAPPVVYLADDCDVGLVVRVMKDRTVDFLPRRTLDETALQDAVRQAFARNAAERAAFQRRQHREALLGRLTDAERDVLNLLVRTGAGNRRIAAELGLTHEAVEGRRSRMMRKLGVNNVIELIRLAVDRS